MVLMTISEAFDKWAALPGNATLAANSRTAFRSVVTKPFGDVGTEQFTETFCRRLFAGSSDTHDTKVKAASVLVHVLQWAAGLGLCKRPSFTFDIANEPVAAAKEENGEGTVQATQSVAAGPVAGTSRKSAPSADGQPVVKGKKRHGSPPRRVTQIDPVELQPIKEYQSIREAADEVGCLPSNIHRALTYMHTAAGCYWSDAADAGTFKERLADKKFTIHSIRATKSVLKKEAMAAKAAKERKASDRPLSGGAAVEALKKAIDKVNQRAAAVPSAPLPSADARPPLKIWSDQELYDELTRRGWEGELTKRLTPRKDE